MQILLHHPDEIPSLRNQGFMAAPGQHTFAAISMYQVYTYQYTVNRETSASVLISRFSRFDGLSRNLNAAKMSFRGLPMLRVLGRVKNRENKTPRICRNRCLAKIKRRENKAIYSIRKFGVFPFCTGN